MARPYSLDLRERVVAQVARGMTREAVAELNGMVSSTVTKWCKRTRESGSPAAKPMGGHRPVKLEGERGFLLLLVDALWTTTFAASGTCRDQSCVGALTDEVAFEFGQRGKEMEDQRAA